MFVYSSELFRSLAPAPENISIKRTLRKVLFKLNIWHPRNRSSSKTVHGRVSKHSTCKRQSKLVQSQLRIGSLNSRSATNKAALLHNTLLESHLDVMAITETWIPSDAPQAIKADLAPPGYNVIHKHRGLSTDKRGGGLAVVARDNLRQVPIDLGSFESFESLSVKITSPAWSILLSVVYRSPSSSKPRFISELDTLLDQLIKQPLPFLLCGDFNFPLSPHSDDELSLLLNEHSLIQHINFPTHNLGQTLDLAITPSNQTISIDVSGKNVTSSDHLLLEFSTSFVRPPWSVKKYAYRPMKKVNWGKFSDDLEIASATLLATHTDVESYSSLLDQELTRLMNSHATLRSRSLRVSASTQSWLSEDARNARRSYRRLEREHKHDKSALTKQKLKHARQLFNKAVLQSRADNLKSVLSNSSTNPRLLWRNLNNILHSNITHNYSPDECRQMSSQFGLFFKEKIDKIRASISSSIPQATPSPSSPRQHIGPVMNTFNPVTPDEVHRLISSLPNKSSPLDVIATSVIKRFSLTFSLLIAKLANLSFKDCIFPTTHKIAQVLPLLKKPNLDPLNPANYRPISNLTTFSKIIERLALHRIRPHLLSNSNYSSYQSAYRCGHSTETALLHTVDGVTSSSKNGCTMLVTLDLSAAFDTVDHTILLRRLDDEFAIRDSALLWLKSYLSDRKQFVKLGDSSTELFSLDVGVPQGSVLGPILFTTYTSPIGDLISNFGYSHHLYADDTSIHIPISSTNTMADLQKADECIQRIQDWHLENQLQLNPSKFEAMMLGTRRSLQRLSVASVHLANTSIELSSTIKLLGVILDSTLCLDKHVSTVVRACNYQLWALRHIRHLLPVDVAASLCRCLILSRLDYCNSLLHQLSASLRKLQSIQNKAARLVIGGDAEPTEALRALHWLPVADRITFKVALLAHKALSTGMPRYLASTLSPHSHSRCLRSMTSNFLNIPIPRNKFEAKSFKYIAPQTWNALPTGLRASESFSQFKAGLKTHLFPQQPRTEHP